MAHPRETFNSQELAVVLSNYDLGIVLNVTDFPRGSHAAPKAVVHTDRGRYLLKRRPRAEKDLFRVAFSHELQAYLASKNFPLPHLIGTRKDNVSMLKVGESIYEVFEFIEGGPYDGQHGSTYEAGKILGLYHKLVHEFESQYEPPRGHYHDAKTVYDAFSRVEEIVMKSPSAKGRGLEVTRTILELSQAYASAAQFVNDLGLNQWELQIVHSDWHPGNMIFRDGHVVAVIDYDAARIRPRVTDVANGCLQFSLITGGRDLTTWVERADDERARRFLAGYDEINVLSQAELKSTPYLMQEALIAQAIPPILKTGTFAGLDAFAFLAVMLRKVRWLRAHADRIALDPSAA